MAASRDSVSSRSKGHDKLDVRKFNVDYDTGFMLKNPLKVLPPYFEPWNKIASSLPTLIQEKTLRDAVEKLPLLDHTHLVGYQQLRLAHLQLSIITAGYVWQNGDKGIAKVLPSCLSIPYYKISAQLGVQPIFSHLDLALANWSLIDPNGSYNFENLECLYHLPGGRAADWFCIVTFMVELSFAKCLKFIAKIVDLLGSPTSPTGEPSYREEIEAEISRCLLEVINAMKAMEKSLSRMRDHLDAKVFFNVIRPLLGGWGGEGTSLPDGLIYEGISDIPFKFIGGSAAQSSTLQVLDALLGVKHTEDKKEFLVKMRDHMPPEHKHFIEFMEQLPYTLRDLVTSSTNETLKSCYNQSLSALIDLRDYHIKIVKMYVILPSRRANEGNYESLDKQGTGGTSLLPFLKKIWLDTKEKLLPDSQKSSTVSSKSQNGASLALNVFVAGLALVAVGFVARSLRGMWTLGQRK